MNRSSEITKTLLSAPGGILYYGHQTGREASELLHIEQAARICYKSEDKMNDESAVKLFDMLMAKGHYAMVRFGERTVVLKDQHLWYIIQGMLVEHQQIGYWRWKEQIHSDETSGSYQCFLTGNFQSWYFLAKILDYESRFNSSSRFFLGTGQSRTLAIFLQEVFQDWPQLWKFMKPYVTPHILPPAKSAPWREITQSELNALPGLKRHMFLCITDRGITHELVRSTTLSYAQESSRWIGYDGREVEQGPPICWIPEHLRQHPSAEDFAMWLQYSYDNFYKKWRSPGMGEDRLVPGDARNFLPHCLKTEIAISGYMDESPIGREFNQGLSHFIDIRCANPAHKGIRPIAREMAKHLGVPYDENVFPWEIVPYSNLWSQ